jgi:hypothetical protein
MQLAPTAVRNDLPTPIGLQKAPAEQVVYLTEMDGTGGYLKRAGGDAKLALQQATEAAKALSAGDAPAAIVFQGPGEDTVFDIYVGVAGVAPTQDADPSAVKPYVLTGDEVVMSPFALAVVDGEKQAQLLEMGP